MRRLAGFDPNTPWRDAEHLVDSSCTPVFIPALEYPVVTKRRKETPETRSTTSERNVYRCFKENSAPGTDWCRVARSWQGRKIISSVELRTRKSRTVRKLGRPRCESQN